MTAVAIAAETGIARSTVRDWLAGRVPAGQSSLPGREPATDELPAAYPYLLGMYLGDGCISAHRRDVFRLRISLDAKYPGIITECERAIRDLLPANRVWRGARPSGFTDRPEKTCVEVSAYSKLLPTLFPQHGPGKKHERRIVLTDWQWQVVEANPEGALRGLIHSDGCRGINTGTNWRHPRYSFRNLSDDIRGIFERCCFLVGVHFTRAPTTVYVSRKADVAKLDTFIGPKR